MVDRSRLDNLICELWVAIHDLSHCYESPEKDMTDEDLILWSHVTKHSAIQNKLQKAIDNGKL